MSVVTNCILAFDLLEDEHTNIIIDVNSYFINECGFVSIDDPSLKKGWYGGSKMFETRLYLGAFNHLDLNGFLEHLKSIKFRYRGHVQLIKQGQYESVFSVLTLESEL